MVNKAAEITPFLGYAYPLEQKDRTKIRIFGFKVITNIYKMLCQKSELY